MNFPKISILILIQLVAWPVFAAMPPPFDEVKDEPVVYTGKETGDKRWHHGGFRAAVGVHKIQAYRATRNQPLVGDIVGWTYNHAPMLAYWRGRFWMNYVSNRVEEHGTPGKTGFTSSIDGYHWEFPKAGFPIITLPELKPPSRYFGGRDMAVIPEGTESVMHQRMGFYVAPNGRLLTSGFYSYCPNVRYGPNRGQGLGRVIREVYTDGELGPIYFIRYNRHAGWNESNTPFSFYKTTQDSGLLEACEALLADKRMTLQWWEDDRGDDGFFTLEIPPDLKISDQTFGPIPEDDVNYIEPKALSFYERPDGVTVGLFKSGLATLSQDDGQTWSKGRHNFPETAAKIWGQKTEDGRYVLVYDHSATNRNRFPLVAVSGDDGYAFDNILTIHAEVPPMRFRGVNKALGPQYIRGIVPGNGNPPGDHMWLTYSGNKEDLWVARVHTPLTGSVSDHLDESFDDYHTLADMELWNLYLPQWAPVSLVSDPWDSNNQVLQIVDEEPYDYAKVEHHIPSSKRVRISFRVMQKQYGLNGLEFEAQTARGIRPMRLWWFPNQIGFDRAGTEVERVSIKLGHWHQIKLELDCEEEQYSVSVDGKVVHAALDLEENPEAIERLVFRTGPWRMDVRQFIMENGEPGAPGVWDGDHPGADTKVSASIYLIDDLKTERF
ncbi:MAG: hypothetical protein O7C75_08180 [Verrucomicrobia bacterium]|nr:hypothetical protein [Verrucomicrobiota bacterium]